jgi:hypothetical protein
VRPSKSDIADLVGERPLFQRREWRVDRVGWVVMGLILVAGLLGVWGGGLLGNVTATGSDGRMCVDYDRFVRNLGQSSLIVTFPPGSAEQGMISMSIDQQYLTANEVESTTPQPDSVTAREGRFVFEFPADEGADLTAQFDLRPNSGAGVRTATIESNSGAPVRLWQFVYPRHG